VIAVLATAWAAPVELELGTGLRAQQAGALASDDLFLFTTSTVISAGGRLRVPSDDGRLALEMYGAGDVLAPFAGARAQRWGGLRGMVGFTGRTPMSTTTTFVRGGVATWDIHDIRGPHHEPVSFGSFGLEVRRLRGGRLQSLEVDALANERLWGVELRSRAGFALGESGAFVTIGGGTSRFSAWQAGVLSQVTYQLETSVLWTLGGP